MPILESDFQNLSTVQSPTQPGPATVASAVNMPMPLSFMTVVSGTAAINFIPPPIAGAHMLCLIPTGAFTFTAGAGSNIAAASTAVLVNVPTLLIYNPTTKKYYVMKGGAIV